MLFLHNNIFIYNLYEDNFKFLNYFSGVSSVYQYISLQTKNQRTLGKMKHLCITIREESEGISGSIVQESTLIIFHKYLENIIIPNNYY